MNSFFTLFMDKKMELLELFFQHMNMTTMAVFISLLIGVPVGILITRNKAAAQVVIGIANVMQSIPCIALLAFSIPFVGIGEKPAILMVIVYALLPIIKNTYTGITSIDPKTIEMAKGLGMTTWKRLFRVELPIAAPFIMSGIRISAVAAVGILCGALVLVPAFTSLQESMAAGSKKTVVIGTSNFTEALILGYIYANLIESNTDTILANMLKRPIHTKEPEALYAETRTLMEEEHQISISAPLGFNNTYVMSVMPDTAGEHQLKTLSDLMRVAPELSLGCTVEFVQREDCLDLLEGTFGTSFKNIQGLDASIRYEAVEAGEVDVIDAFATDALLPKAGLVKLEDDVQFFPPYYAVNLVRDEILSQYPELKDVLAQLDGKISEDTMAKMNAAVDIDGKDASEVAHEFLVEEELVGVSRR